MNYRLLNLFVLLFGGLLIISSCSKDKDLDDYKNEKLQTDLAEYKAIEGSYSGYLTSNRPGQEKTNLGAVTISLIATTQTVNNNDGSRASAQPILLANVKYYGTYAASIGETPNISVYEPNTGHFHTEIEIPFTNELGREAKEIIMIEGNIAGGILEGRMYAASASGIYEGGRFTLNQDNSSLEDLAMNRKPDVISERDPIQKIYTGTGLARNPRTRELENLSVRLNVQQPVRTRYDEVLFILKPHREIHLIASMNAVGVLMVSFPIIIWNDVSGSLTGSTTLQAMTSPTQNTVTLSCKKFYFLDKDYNFDCTFTSALLGEGVKFTFTDMTDKAKKTNWSK